MTDLERLETLLGNPWDSANTAGFAAIAAADEQDAMAAGGAGVLDQYGLNAEFVPQALGGRLAGLNRLVAVMRAVFRRDPALGLGYGASSFLAAVNVWTAGSTAQREAVAARLLAGERLACAYHELDHGNDIGQAHCRADIEAGAIRLNGQKHVIANIARASAMVVYARTDDGAGARSHSLVLVERAQVAPGTLRDLPRYTSGGMRGIALGGVEFADCVVPASGLVGERGRGLETALKAFQLTRVALPGMFAGIVDTGLRLTLRHCRGRKLYGGTVLDLPAVRHRLAEVFADLLWCDGMVTVAANAAHVLPAELSLLSASVKALVPGVLIRAMNTLAAVLGAHSYLREGDMLMFQKLLGDLQPAGFGHASRVSCLMTLLPQLPQLARRAWGGAADTVPALFALDADAAALPFGALALVSGGRDTLAASLLHHAECGVAANEQERQVLAQVRRCALQLLQLKTACGALRPADITAQAAPATFALAERYVTLMAASACVGIWQAQRGGTDSFLARPEWIAAVLQRAATAPRQRQAALPAPLAEALLAELLRRYDRPATFDLAGHQLPASAGWC